METEKEYCVNLISALLIWGTPLIEGKRKPTLGYGAISGLKQCVSFVMKTQALGRRPLSMTNTSMSWGQWNAKAQIKLRMDFFKTLSINP